LKSSEVLGRPIWDIQFTMAPYHIRTHTAYQQLKEMLVSALATGSSPAFGKPSDRKVKFQDGADRFVQSLVFPIKTDRGYLLGGFLFDITERKLAEEAIKIERDRAQQYLDIAGVILVAIAAEQTVTLINRKGCELLGCAEEEIIGKNWFDNFLPEQDRAPLKKLFASLISGNLEGRESAENCIITRSGKVHMILWHNSLLCDIDGNIVGTLSSGEDITERKRIEAEREHMTAELQEALAKIKTLSGFILICA